MSEQGEERFHWIVMFAKGGKLYPYLNRTVPHMAGVVKRFESEHNSYPYRMWVIVDDEVQKVEIK